MLFKQVLSPNLWKLLTEVMDIPALSDFFLVGDTALALRLGHRQSDDLDLFCRESFEPAKLADYMTQKLGAPRVHHEPETVKAFISGIKVDILRHPYPMIAATENIDGIRIASLPDLCAMKLNAISGRGIKKDFYDVAALMKSYSLHQMIDFFKQKYSSGDSWHLIRALAYFDDAEKDKSEVRSIWPGSWQEIKSAVATAIDEMVRSEST